MRCACINTGADDRNREPSCAINNAKRDPFPTATSTATTAPASTPTTIPSPTATHTPKPTIDQALIATLAPSGPATVASAAVPKVNNPHATVTGITAYLARQFSADYFNNLFVILWSAFPGAEKIVRIQLSPFKISDFALGLADPVDVTISPNGALVVADWAIGHILKISYAP